MIMAVFVLAFTVATTPSTTLSTTAISASFGSLGAVLADTALLGQQQLGPLFGQVAHEG